jgi:hypothetical protein
MRVLKFWDKMSEVVKRDLLKKVGVRDPREEVLPTTPSVSLTAWGEYLPLGLRYSAECQCKFVPPAFVQAFEAGQATILRAAAGEFSMSFAELEDQAQRQEYRQKLLKNWWGQNEVLLVCMCDEASGAAGLLALRTTPMSVRYYLAGAEVSEAISRQASLILGQLDGVAHEVPPRSNCCRDEVEPVMAHYIEGEMREAHGETRGCLGWAKYRLKRVRGHLKGLHHP